MRIRLKAPCHIGGKLHQAGDIVTLKDGERGPHRAVHKSADRIDYDPSNGLDANRILGDVEDVPLFDVLDEEEAPPAPSEPPAPRVIPTPPPPRPILPAPPQPHDEVRSLTHIEERDRR